MIVVDLLRDCKRIIRMSKLEAWDININSKSCRVILVDENRPSIDDDFPWLPNGLGEDKEDRRENHITAHVVSISELNEDEEKVLYNISEHLVEHVALAYCNVSVFFKTQDLDQALDELLLKNTNSDFNGIPLKRFINFSQD